MENTVDNNSQIEYLTNLIKRFEHQRNEALNSVAVLETELLKSQKIIASLEEKIKNNNSLDN